MLPDPPPLPRRLADPMVAVRAATLAWFAGFLGLGSAWLVAGRPLDVWFGTCLCGWILGVVGIAILRWQRSAARRPRGRDRR